MSLTTLQFKILPAGLSAIAEATGNSSALSNLCFRPFNSIYNMYMDVAIPVTTAPSSSAIASIGIVLNSGQGNYLFDGIDIFISPSVANATTYSSVTKTNVFATSYVSGSLVYVLIDPQIQKYSSFTSTPNIINIQAVFEDIQPSIAATFSPSVVTTLLTAPLEIPSVDQLIQAPNVTPGTTMGSNLTLCGFDDTSARVLAKLYESTGRYSFSGMQSIGTLTPSSFTLNQATFSSTLLSSASFVSGRFIIQIISGGNSGICRYINAITSTSNSFTLQWITPLIGALTTGTQIVIYQSGISIINSINNALVPINSSVGNIPFNQINVVDYVDMLPKANIYGSVNNVLSSALYLVGNRFSTSVGGLDSGYRSLAKSASNYLAPKWSFDKYIPLVSYNGALGFNPESLTVSSYSSSTTNNVVTGVIQVVGNLQNLANYFSNNALNTTTNQNVVQNLFLVQFLTGTFGNISSCRQVSNITFNSTTNVCSISILLRVPLSSPPVAGDTFEILYDRNNTINDLFMQLNTSPNTSAIQSTLTSYSNTVYNVLGSQLQQDEINFNSIRYTLASTWMNSGNLAPTGYNTRQLSPTFLNASSAYIYYNDSYSSMYIGITIQGGGNATVRAYVSKDNVNYDEVAYGSMGLGGNDIYFIFFAVPKLQHYQVVSTQSCILWNEFCRR